MTTNISNEDETWINAYPEFSLPPSVRFWLLIIFDIPSLFCSFFLLYHLLLTQTLRSSLNNHVIIVLLIIGLFSQLLDIPFYLNFIQLNYVWPSLPITCVLWWFSATGISNLTSLIMAWASIERHILVFHDRWLLTSTKRFLIHYLPLLIIVLYGFLYYIVILVIYPCENMYAYSLDWCLYPCYYNDAQLAQYDTVVNSILPTPIIVLASITLIIRVIKQKQILHRQIQWRKYRRMIIQLLSISALFLFFNLPMTSLVLAHTFDVPNGAAGQFEYYTYYLYHFISLLIPFVSLTSLPEVKNKIRRIFIFRRMVNVITPKPNSRH